MNDNHDYIEQLQSNLAEIKDNRDYLLEQLQEKKSECRDLELSLNESVARLNKSKEELKIANKYFKKYMMI